MHENQGASYLGRPIENKLQNWLVEPVVGFEPTTDGLQNRCSTTELNWLKIWFQRHWKRSTRSSMSPTQTITRFKINPEDSGQEDSTSLKLLKVADCLYRRGERDRF